jgi:hypothetical protein
MNTSSLADDLSHCHKILRFAQNDAEEVPISTNYRLKTPARFIRPINPTSANPYDALHAKKSLLRSDLLQELKQFVTGKFLQLSTQ